MSSQGTCSEPGELWRQVQSCEPMPGDNSVPFNLMIKWLTHFPKGICKIGMQEFPNGPGSGSMLLRTEGTRVISLWWWCVLFLVSMPLWIYVRHLYIKVDFCSLCLLACLLYKYVHVHVCIYVWEKHIHVFYTLMPCLQENGLLL